MFEISLHWDSVSGYGCRQVECTFEELVSSFANCPSISRSSSSMSILIYYNMLRYVHTQQMYSRKPQISQTNRNTSIQSAAYMLQKFPFRSRFRLVWQGISELDIFFTDYKINKYLFLIFRWRKKKLLTHEGVWHMAEICFKWFLIVLFSHFWTN